MYIHRALEKTIIPFLKRKEAIAIIGARQTGKTTFLRHLESELIKKKKKVKYVTFENRDDLALFQEDIEDFKDLIKGYDYIIIDEFQYAKDGGQKLKYLYDTSKIKFIVSGSSSLELTFQTGKYMVGRLLEFELTPFSFREYLSFADKELYDLLERKINSSRGLNFNIKSGFGRQINNRLVKMLEKYAVYGGYPAVALAKSDTEKEKLLEGIIEKYLLKDIKGLLNLATEDNLVRLGRFLASQVGQIVKYEELSNASNLSYKELLKHLNILEKTYIIKIVRPFYTNKRIELTKNPKIYFKDVGIRNFLLSDFRSVPIRNDLGQLMENYAFNMLENLFSHKDFKYWRTKSKAEVDFVIEKQQSIYPIEIKYVSRRLIGKSIHSFIDKFKSKIGIIFTKNYLAEEKIKGTKMKFIPLCYF